MSDQKPPNKGQSGFIPTLDKTFEVQIQNWESGQWLPVIRVSPSDTAYGRALSIHTPELFAAWAYVGFLVVFCQIPPQLANSLPLPELSASVVNLKNKGGVKGPNAPGKGGQDSPESHDTAHDQNPPQNAPESPEAYFKIVNNPQFKGFKFRVIEADQILKPPPGLFKP